MNETPTPRTDASILHIDGGTDMSFDYVLPEVAKQLERELAEANRVKLDHFENLQLAKQEIVKTSDDRDRLMSLLSELAFLLRLLEWSAWEDGSTCPRCRRREANGHTPDCKLAAYIAAVEAELKGHTPMSGGVV